MRTAVLTPWPPQASGIADYAYTLLSGLASRMRGLEVITTCSRPKPLGNLPVHTVSSGRAPDLSGYDTLVFHLGNHAVYHGWMIDLLSVYGGVVHLHDLVLQHMVSDWCEHTHNQQYYLDLLSRWYGRHVSHAFRHLLHDRGVYPWETELALCYPLCEEVLRHAHACIVHSGYVKQRIKAVFPDMPVYRVDHMFDIAPAAAKPVNPDMIKLGIFGGVQPNRHVDAVLRSLARLPKHGNWQLNIAGTVGSQCRNIFSLVKELGLDKQVRFHGRLPLAEFMALMADMDLCLALRHPTMGETSGVAVRCLQLGVPLVVNATGWYAELPAFIPKVPVTQLEDHLSLTLAAFLSRPQELDQLKITCRQYALSHDFATMVACYQDLLTQCDVPHLVTGNSLVRRLKAVVADLELTGRHAAPLLNGLMARIHNALA